MSSKRVAGSFRDPSGFVFEHDGRIYRQINQCYATQYDRLMQSGLYEHLAENGLLIRHEEVSGIPSTLSEECYKIIKPEMIPFVSYPYEWSFSQLQDAALSTLAIQQVALKYGMVLKDCSAYNIQFLGGKPVFIDTLSLEEWTEGSPWTPYRQFCQHFLAPLALMSSVDIRLGRMLTLFVDGVPLDVASRLLPFRSRLNFGQMLHIHAHARSQGRYSDEPIERAKFTRKVSRNALLGLLDSLESAVKRLSWNPAGTEWADYYNDDSYTETAFEHKRSLVKSYLATVAPAVVWDMGANNGFYSRIAIESGALAIAFDIDPACVELNYREAKKSGESRMLPLLLDLTNPSPDIGWANQERQTVSKRGCADTAMALALVHHLAISNNVPLPRVAEYFSGLCKSLIIEFVPKSDHKVKKLLATREDVFPNYTQQGFEESFLQFFSIERSDSIVDSERTMYLMRRR